MPTSAQRLASKRAQREANREAWRNDPRNRNAHNFAVRAEVKPVEPVLDEDVGALDLLREIMRDDDLPLGRRLRAAGHVLRFELPIAGAVGMPPDQVSNSSAYRFLVGVVRSGASAEHKQAAAEILAVFENERPVRTNPDELVEARLRLIAMINSTRRAELALSGHWPVPPGSPRWWLSSDDVFDADGLVSSPACSESTSSIAEALDRARALDPIERKRQMDERRQRLLEVTAHGRDDTSWRCLLTAEPERKTG
jgi:hypothetical protein